MVILTLFPESVCGTYTSIACRTQDVCTHKQFAWQCLSLIFRPLLVWSSSLHVREWRGSKPLWIVTWERYAFCNNELRTFISPIMCTGILIVYYCMSHFLMSLHTILYTARVTMKHSWAKSTWQTSHVGSMPRKSYNLLDFRWVHTLIGYCGYVRDPTIMNKTVLLAKQNKVRVGAHPSLPDRQGFGRREMQMEPVSLIIIS